MAKKTTVLKAIAGYFNDGEGKRPLREFQMELKALSDAEKLELARGVTAITGDELVDAQGNAL